jgi:DNA end-binding protein Ku
MISVRKEPIFHLARPFDTLNVYMPPLRTGLLSFGLASIPVQLHPASQNQNVSFHWLHNKCGSRIQNRYYCPVCNVPVERDDLVRNYEFAKRQYVRLTEAELDSLETESSNSIDLKEFIPLSTVDPVYFERAYYLGAGEGGEKPYRLLVEAMVKSMRSPNLSVAIKNNSC